MFFAHQIDDETSLAPLQLSDAAPLFEETERSRAHLRAWLPWLDQVRSMDDTRRFIEVTLKKGMEDRSFSVVIWHRGELAGICGLHAVDSVNRRSSIGYWLGERFQGHGLMRRTVAAVVHHVFDRMDLNRLEIRTAVGNGRSEAIPRSLGFREEGICRDAEWLYDRFVDHRIWAQLKREWADLRSQPDKA
ncbi:MAG: GNAT family N-acetyltransferase [Opitutales bacterium]